MFTLVVSSMIAFSSLFSSTVALDSFTIPNLSLEQCTAEAKKRGVDEKTDGLFHKSQMFIKAVCVEQK